MRGGGRRSPRQSEVEGIVLVEELGKEAEAGVAEAGTVVTLGMPRREAAVTLERNVLRRVEGLWQDSLDTGKHLRLPLSLWDSGGFNDVTESSHFFPFPFPLPFPFVLLTVAS